MDPGELASLIAPYVTDGGPGHAAGVCRGGALVAQAAAGCWNIAPSSGAETMGGAMRIDEKVRDAHLEHFCPGGLGLAVTTSRPAWPGQPGAAPPGLDGNAARAAGQRCGRCRMPMTPGQDVRRRVSGTWVHENCPA